MHIMPIKLHSMLKTELVSRLRTKIFPQLIKTMSTMQHNVLPRMSKK